MEESEFINLCDESLNEIADLLEQKDVNSMLDIEYLDGILELEIIDENLKYIINRNSGNQKIWYSSPFSGVDYFSYDASKKSWQNDHGLELTAKILQELDKYFN